MAYWLFKAEPEDYTFEELEAEGEAEWDGVRNHQAARNMRAMAVGDLAFFYRSVQRPALVGLMRISRAAWPDPDDPRFVRVAVMPVRRLPREVPLREIKARPELGHLALVRQPRLSVMPVDAAAFRTMLQMAGLDPASVGVV